MLYEFHHACLTDVSCETEIGLGPLQGSEPGPFARPEPPLFACGKGGHFL